MAPMTEEEKRQARKEREEQKIINQWRTVVCAMVGVVVLLIAFIFLSWPRAATVVVPEKAFEAFEVFAKGVMWLIGFVAAKAAWEHTAKHNGVLGSLRALFMPNQPPTPPAGG